MNTDRTHHITVSLGDGIHVALTWQLETPNTEVHVIMGTLERYYWNVVVASTSIFSVEYFLAPLLG